MKEYFKIFLSLFILYHFSANAQQFTLVNTDIIPAPNGEVQWGDFNDDGKLDVLISGYPYGDFSLLIPGSPAFIYRNDGNNKFVNINAPIDSSSYVKWIDVNNDNYLDIFLSDEKAIYLNLKGTFQKITLPISNRILSYDWGDYNNDEVRGYSSNLIKGAVINGVVYGDTIVTSVKFPNNLTLSYKLFQNYPNPFNPTTKINYSIPHLEYVTLKIYDILGRLVTTLVKGKKQAGNYIAEFNGGNLSSGVYFYKIRAGNFVKTKKCFF